MRTKWAPTILVSYAYWDSAARTESKMVADASRDGRIELILDSGAFTALNAGKEIRLSDYMQFLHDHRDVFFGYMQLDKLGDPVVSDRNLQTMLDAGLSPIPIHVRGDDQTKMDSLFSVSDWVALGGFRRPHRGPAPKSYVKLKMDWARGRNVHWLGYVDVKMVSSFRPYSVDCSSWSAGHVYGTLALYQGGGRWTRVPRKDKAKHRLTPSQTDLLARCGFSVSDFYDDRYWAKDKKGGVFGRRFMPGMVNMVSWLLFSREIRRRFGTRLYLAFGLAADEIDEFRLALDILDDM